MLTKHNVCLFIKDEEHLEEMREFLESKDESLDFDMFYISSNDLNYLQIDMYNFWVLFAKTESEVTTEQFKKLWE